MCPEKVINTLPRVSNELPRHPAPQRGICGSFERRNMDNNELYEEALEAITTLYSDKSVSKQDCAENMKELIGEIQGMIDALGIDE